MTTSSPDERVREVAFEVLRTARVAVVDGASGPPEGVREAWYVLHGYRQLARRFLRRFVGVAAPGRLVAAPEGLSRFYLDAPARPHGKRDAVGASWMTREDREAEIRDYLRYLDLAARSLEGDADSGPPARTLLGFSQGAHTAARWAVMGSCRPARLVLWGAGLPRDLPDGAERRLRDVEIALVRGKLDELRRPDEEARDEAWLEEVGIPYRVLHHPGGHEIDAELLGELAGTPP